MAYKEQRFIVTAAAFSGAKYLTQYLRTHRDIKMYQDVFRSDAARRGGDWAGDQVFHSNTEDVLVREGNNPYTPGQNGGTFIKNALFYSRYGKPPSGVGFTFLYHQGHQDLESRKAWAYLQQNSHIKIVHIIRENLVDVWIKLERAAVGKLDKKRSYTTPYRSSVQGFKQHLIRTIKYRSLIKKLFQFHPLLEIEYQNHLQNNLNPTLSSIEEFIGVTHQLKRFPNDSVNATDDESVVSNYEELIQIQQQFYQHQKATLRTQS